jgi:NifB/MoaA-like Fe-S oxidoreductase
VSRLTGHRVEALAVANRFFGERITVTGLLTGGDILAAIRAAGPANRVYVPDVLLNAGRFLDDMTLSQMAEALGVPVEGVAPSPLALARTLAA